MEVLEQRRPYGRRRWRNEIDLELIEAIYLGTNEKAALMRKVRLSYPMLMQTIKRLKDNEMVVSVKFREPTRGTAWEKFAVTERALLWRVVMQRAKELEPK